MHSSSHASPRPLTVAIIGATGAVGKEMIAVLEDRVFPLGTLRPMASRRSAGQVVQCQGRSWFVEELPPSEAMTQGLFDGIDVVLLAVSKDLAQVVAPLAVRAGSIVVDNSSAFRMDPSTPLVVPEVNGDLLDAIRTTRRAGEGCLIANPNCSTILALVAVTPIHRLARVTRMVVSTYQAASGAGIDGMNELESQAHSFSRGEPWTTSFFGRPSLFNVFSHDSAVGADGANEEERKLLLETQRIWNDSTVGVSATCVRVPVLRAHSESINLTLERPTTESAIRLALENALGVELVDDRAANRFPEPRLASGRDNVLVGRIRMDSSQPEGRGVSLFLAGDQLRKGAALNAVQIVERLVSTTQEAGGAKSTLSALPGSGCRHKCSPTSAM
ncbi:MAG: aspartate-semialdehyde dehydrogenase [Planctomycetota bacterium]|nr:aspartate-semialdehyde dehydrogenase [Planctomycetota bacterium]